MVNEHSVNRAYFRKAGYAGDMNRIGHILVYLGYETWSVKMKKIKIGTMCGHPMQ